MTTQPGGGSVPQWTLLDRLRKAREHAGMSQGELAEAIGVGRSTISNYEMGVTPTKRPILLSWSMACGVSLDWLMTGRRGDSDEPVSDTSFGCSKNAAPGQPNRLRPVALFATPTWAGRAA